MKSIYVLSLSSVSIIAAITATVYAADISAHGAENGTPEMQYIKNAQQLDIRQLDGDNKNAYLEDIVTSGGKDHPISCGLFRMEKGKPLKYTYEYPEAKIILEGQMTISDGKTTVTAYPGDVFFFPIGAAITFSSINSGLGFTCGKRTLNGT